MNCFDFQILKSSPMTYKSVIGDFNTAEQTVFHRTGITTHWKPVMLVSSEHIRLFAYLLMYRDGEGRWALYVRSFADREFLKDWESHITVRPAGEAKAATPSWSFAGPVVAHDAMEAEVHRAGNFLRLTDDQVKLLTDGKTLFHYEVELRRRRL